jgi:hypothetical protein
MIFLEKETFKKNCRERGRRKNYYFSTYELLLNVNCESHRTFMHRLSGH